MINIDDKAKCCGCTACASICPKKCINMKPDEEGFLYPEVDKDSCAYCHLCEKVCPVINMPEMKELEKTSCVVRNKDKTIVESSSSGGFFSALAEYVIERNGVVVGVIFDNELKIKHYFADTKTKCSKFMGSKYVQSNKNNVFVKVKEYLDDERLVCFSGTPCEVAGLRNYLNRDYDNLILVDLVCHGVPSPLLWDKYIELMEKKHDSRVIKANFRCKKYGYQSSTMMLEFENGKKHVGSPRVDIMLKAFFTHIALRPSCYNCSFKGVDRCADFTVFDCWHAGKVLNIKDDDKGYTSVIVHGKKAKDIMEVLRKKCEIFDALTEKVVPIKGGMMVKSAKPHTARSDFYAIIVKDGLQEAINRFIPIKKSDYTIESIKTILKRIGILPLISRTKKYLRKKRISQ